MDHPSPERYLSASVRELIEQRYYMRVNEQAKLENLIRDPLFMENSAKHPAFYSDHGVVHVRDVARQSLRVLHTINGVLIPRRTEQQLELFLYGYGVALAYLHDIGMSDLSPFGRAMHPEFAAHAMFNGSLEDALATMWDDNCGNIPWHLSQLFRAGALKRDPQIVFRELLALSMAHSKSKVPVTVLDDPSQLRHQMQTAIRHHLSQLYCQQQKAKGNPLRDDFIVDEAHPDYLSTFYSDFEHESFDWLTDESQKARELVRDVTDTLRALRCADALRQRGTVEKTSGGYEIYTSQKTGDCIVALRLGGNQLYLMELTNNPDGAGEANIASSEFNSQGNLRISFHRGSFESPEAQIRSVNSTAHVIGDFLRDTVDSFWRAAPIPSAKTSNEILILLESTDDDPHFAGLLREQLCRLNPEFSKQIEVVPSLRNVAESERRRYLDARELDWDERQRQSLLVKMNQSGQKLANFDTGEGFRHVRLTDLRDGERLIEAGAPSAFVYIPLGDGLKVIPIGGYQSFSVAAWMPLGTTGVIRGDIRNADIIAEQPVSLLIIPKEIYLRYWYMPYSPMELKSVLMGKDAGE